MYQYLSASISRWIEYIWTVKVESNNTLSSRPTNTIYHHFLLETQILERSEILDLISKYREFQVLQIIVPKYYSSYLFSQIVFDILDILSNELFFVQTQIKFVFDNETKDLFMDELKENIRKNIPFLQRHKVLPVYCKFLTQPDYHVDYTITLEQRFHILFMKEEYNHLLLQRIYFLIDL